MATVTPLPTPVPSRQDPANFAVRADAFLGALPTFGNELNVVAAEVNANTISASDSADEAALSAIAAEDSADTAATQAGIATNAASEALLATESYQGSLPSDPSLDKNGNTLSAGDWYVNTTLSTIRVYTGSAWVQSVSATGGVTSINGEDGDVVLREQVSVISTNTNAVHGGFYVIAAALTLTLPASPTIGDYVFVQNSSGLTTPVIGRNGLKIMGFSEDMVVNKLHAPFKLVYSGTTYGWVFG